MANEETTPAMSTANVTGSPGTTILAAVLGASQYIATQGMAWPTDATGWVQFLAGIVIAILGALGRMPVKNTALFLFALFVANPTWAFSTPISAAAGEPVSGYCSGCTRATDAPDVSAPMPVFRVPGTGGIFGILAKVPLEATGPSVSVKYNVMRETTLYANDNVCVVICLGVIMPGENASSIQTNCTPSSIDTTWTNSQWNTQEGATVLGISPKRTGGTDCAGTACNGGDLYISMTRLTEGTGCTGGSADSAGFTFVTPIFQ